MAALLPEILKEAGEATNWSVSLSGLGMAKDLVKSMENHGSQMWTLYRFLHSKQLAGELHDKSIATVIVKVAGMRKWCPGLQDIKCT